MCAFCEMGICQNSAHRARELLNPGGAGPNLGEQPIPLFDIRRSAASTRAPAPLTRSPSLPQRGVLVSPEPSTYWNPSQTDEARHIERLLRTRMGSTHEIPKNIHRFWTGGPMRPAVVKQLLEDGGRAKAAGWTCHLWYSATVEKALDGHLDQEIAKTKGLFVFSKRPPMPKDERATRALQRQKLERAGYRVVPIERLDDASEWLTTIALGVGHAAVARNWDEVKYFSDLARLLYLNFVGGIHMDVDIALGDMELGRRYYHNDPGGQVPLMGSLLRDQKDELIPHLRYLKGLRHLLTLTKEQHDRYHEALAALVKRGRYAAGMFNALIASRPNTTHLQDTIDEFRQAITRNGSLISGMALARTLLIGKARTLDLDQAMAWTVPPYLVRLDPDTEESNL